MITYVYMRKLYGIRAGCEECRYLGVCCNSLSARVQD
jgi:hypothetical protein